VREISRKLAKFGIPLSLIRILPNGKGKLLIEVRKNPNRLALIRKAAKGRPLNPADFRSRTKSFSISSSLINDDRAVRQLAEEIKRFLNT